MRGTFADGQRVTAARHARGLTQEQLASLAGLDAKTVRKAEQGKRLDVATLGRLAAALGVDLHRLVRTGPSEPDAELARREAVLAWRRGWDAQDIGALLALYHDDAVLYLPGQPGVPFGGAFQGKDEIRRCHETAWATCPTEPARPEDFSLLVSGDAVVLRGVKGIRLPNGEVARLWAVQIFTFADDRIVEHRVEYDTLALCKLLQFPPPAPRPADPPGSSR